MIRWNAVADIFMAGGNPYHQTAILNWPPVWPELIFLCKKLSLATHLPFNLIIRTLLIIAESALGWLLFLTMMRFSPSAPVTKLLLAGIAVNPVPILEICQHSNFDVLVGFWVLLAVYMLLRFQAERRSEFWLLACFAVGMGTLTKTVPLCLAPLLLLSVKRLKRAEQFLGVVLVLGPVTLALSVLYVLEPADIQSKVLNYRSIPGYFGVAGILGWAQASRWWVVCPRIFEIVYGFGWACLGVWLWWKDSLSLKQVISIALLLLLAIPTIGPGYAPQYVYWFLPLLILLYALAERRMKRYLLIGYGIGAATYLAEYALFFNTDGSYLMNFIQTGGLLRFALRASSYTNQTLLRFPLWLFYVGLTGFLCLNLGRDMLHDVRERRLRGRVCRTASHGNQ